MSGKQRLSSSSCSDSPGSLMGICTICKDELENDICSTRCGHVFHGSCILKWLDQGSADCPVCRQGIDSEQLVRIYPGIKDRNEIPLSNDHIMTEEELMTLTVETFKRQNIVYNQLSLLSVRLSEQGLYIEKLKANLEDKQQKCRIVEGQREKLEIKLKDMTESNEALKQMTETMKADDKALRNKLEEVGTTMEIMDSLVEQHKQDHEESIKCIQHLESKLENYQNDCKNMEDTLSRLELLRYEVALKNGQHDKSLEDFVEDVLAENVKLKSSLEEAEQKISDAECIKIDLELNLSSLKENLRDLQESYADQSAESKGMEQSLRTMQRLHQDLTDELKDLNDERDLYERDIKHMLDRLKKCEEEKEAVEKQGTEIEVKNISYKEQVESLFASIEKLKKEKDDAEKLVHLKEDVIGSIRSSVEVAMNAHLERLEGISDTASIASKIKETSGNMSTPVAAVDIVALVDQRFGLLVEEVERKENMIIQMMQEKNENDEMMSIEEKISSLEMKDTLEFTKVKLADTKKVLLEKENCVEEKEMIISHLVSVINRYAFNDRDQGPSPRLRLKRESAPVIDPLAINLSVETNDTNQTSGGRLQRVSQPQIPQSSSLKKKKSSNEKSRMFSLRR